MALQLQLFAPSYGHLGAYTATLRTGWSPYAARDVSAEHRAAIEADPDAFLVDLVDLEKIGGSLVEPEGSTRPKLPQIIRWMWDGDFVGVINLRWQPGTDELPPYVSGQIGYINVPRKRGKGYATEALRLMLPEARQLGLGHVELTTDPSNTASQKVIQQCDGRLAFTRDDMFSGAPKLHFRIELAS